MRLKSNSQYISIFFSKIELVCLKVNQFLSGFSKSAFSRHVSNAHGKKRQIQLVRHALEQPQSPVLHQYMRIRDESFQYSVEKHEKDALQFDFQMHQEGDQYL